MTGNTHLGFASLTFFLDTDEVLVSLCELFEDAFRAGATARNIVLVVVGVNDQ